MSSSNKTIARAVLSQLESGEKSDKVTASLAAYLKKIPVKIRPSLLGSGISAGNVCCMYLSYVQSLAHALSPLLLRSVYLSRHIGMDRYIYRFGSFFYFRNQKN